MNIGDSRIVLSKKNPRTTLYDQYPLTIDHKPENKKEKIRLLKHNARIESLKDEYGNYIGPLRIWKKDFNFPGLSMTRSFGDKISVDLGIICEPEIKIFNYKIEDKFIIIASDGIWEFINNEECCRIIGKYYPDEIEMAINEVNKIARKRWMKEEDVIDDISIIIIFLEDDININNNNKNEKNNNISRKIKEIRRSKNFNNNNRKKF